MAASENTSFGSWLFNGRKQKRHDQFFKDHLPVMLVETLITVSKSSRSTRFNCSRWPGNCENRSKSGIRAFELVHLPFSAPTRSSSTNAARPAPLISSSGPPAPAKPGSFFNSNSCSNRSRIGGGGRSAVGTTTSSCLDYARHLDAMLGIRFGLHPPTKPVPGYKDTFTSHEPRARDAPPSFSPACVYHFCQSRLD